MLAYRGRPDWLGECLSSLASEPCRTEVIEGGFSGHVGRARAHALGLGTAPYVTWVDDDDYLRPGVMAQCLAYLDAHEDCVGVYTDLELLHLDGRLIRRRLPPWNPRAQLCAGPWGITHLKVMRRTSVMPYLNEMKQWPTYEEYVLCGLMAAHGYWHHIAVSGCVKRMNPSSESSERLARPGLLRAAARRVAPTLLRANRAEIDLRLCP